MEQIRNAIITSASIRMERGFVLDCWLTLDYGSEGQGFGGWALYLASAALNHRINSGAGHHIWRCMEIAGVESWDKMQGRPIRAKIGGDRIVAIGHIVKEDWYCPAEDFARAKSGD